MIRNQNIRLVILATVTSITWTFADFHPVEPVAQVVPCSMNGNGQYCACYLECDEAESSNVGIAEDDCYTGSAAVPANCAAGPTYRQAGGGR